MRCGIYLLTLLAHAGFTETLHSLVAGCAAADGSARTKASPRQSMAMNSRLASCLIDTEALRD